jgi:hypothetical protein
MLDDLLTHVLEEIRDPTSDIGVTLAGALAAVRALLEARGDDPELIALVKEIQDTAAARLDRRLHETQAIRRLEEAVAFQPDGYGVPPRPPWATIVRAHTGRLGHVELSRLLGSRHRAVRELAMALVPHVEGGPPRDQG